MVTYIYRLHFKGPLHLGLHGIGLEAVEERLASDSLTSAIINAFAVIEGQEGANELVKALLTPNPPFVLSSLFFYGPNRENPTLVAEAVPRPLTNPCVIDDQILQKHGRDLKRIRYLRVNDFRTWINEQKLDGLQLEGMIQRSRELTKGWWREELRPRVAIDRVSNNSSIWNQAAIWFGREERSPDGKVTRAGAGLYGLIRLNDQGWEERVTFAFRMLGEMGLGGERTYGLGLFQFMGFEPLPESWNALLLTRSRVHVFLSTYYPSAAEREGLQANLEAWETTERRGYVVSGNDTTTIKRKRIRMVTEGSVAREVLDGAIIDVTPERASDFGIFHRVYRSGLAFLVPGRS